MRKIHTFSIVKNAVWNCVLDQEVPKSEQMVNLTLLNDVMLEIKVLIDFNELKKPSAVQTRVQPYGKSVQIQEDSVTKQLLKRFTVFSPV